MSKIKIPQLEELTSHEEVILARIKEILDKNIGFYIDSEIVDYCRQKSKSSEFQVYKTLYSLIQRKIIVPGSTLTKEDVLKNENRALIFNQIKEKPGMHIRELSSVVNKSSGVVRAHLQVLENFQYIRKKTYTNPRLTLLFTSDYPDLYDDFFVVTKNENDQRIIQLLINNLTTISELSTQLGVHHSTIQYHLEKLESLNLVLHIALDKNTTKYIFNKTRLDSFMMFLERILPQNNK